MPCLRAGAERKDGRGCDQVDSGFVGGGIAIMLWETGAQALSELLSREAQKTPRHGTARPPWIAHEDSAYM